MGGQLTPALITDFSAGEFSPKMTGRYDLPAYNHGARELFNFIPFFPGGATLRPGFKHIGAAHSATGNVVIKAFTLTQTFSYLLEFGAGYIRFWRNGALVMNGANPAEFSTTWTDSDLENLRFAQDDRALYIASGSTGVMVVTMTALDTFTFQPLALTAREGQLPFQGSGNYPRAIAFMDGRLYLAGTDNEPTTIWASVPFEYGNFTYYDTVTSTTSQMRNPLQEMSADISLGNPIIYILDAALFAKLKIGDRITGENIIEKDKLSFVGKTTAGSNDITQISSAVTAFLEVGETVTGNGIASSEILTKGANNITLTNTATADNALATFQREARYTYITGKNPANNSITVSIPPTLTKASATIYSGWHDPTIPEYETVSASRDVFTSASAFKKTIASDQAERITWLSVGRDLVIGTTTCERTIASGTTTANFKCKKQTAIATADVQPFMLNEAILYLEGNRRAVQSYIYSATEESYNSVPVTAFSDHILKAQAAAMDYQNTPIPIAWFALDDGTLAGLAYSKATGIQAWFRAEHASGAITSLTVLPTGVNDELYVVVKRGTTAYIEKLDTIFEAGYYLDSSSEAIVSAGQITGIAGIPDGTATVTWGDGETADITIAAGSATVPATIANGTAVKVGLKYEGRIALMPIAVNQMRLKTVSKITAKILDCYPFTVRYKGLAPERAGWIGKQTGDRTILVNGIWDTDGSVVIEQENPFETTILAIMVETQAGG